MLQPWIFCYLLMSNKHGAHDMDFFFRLFEFPLSLNAMFFGMILFNAFPFCAPHQFH